MSKPQSTPTPQEWNEGVPPHPFDKEWFIALTTYGDRVVLKALPEEFTYDFKTADETFIMRDKIKCWMQFPDSKFVPYRDELVAALERIANVPDGFTNTRGMARDALAKVRK